MSSIYFYLSQVRFMYYNPDNSVGVKGNPTFGEMSFLKASLYV